MSIDMHRLTKAYSGGFLVSGVSFRVHPGEVVGLLGPNGAGKSVIIRILLGMEGATSGTATFDGRPYRELTAPLKTVGALRPLPKFTWGRSAETYLCRMQARGGIDRERVPAVLDEVGLTAHSQDRIGTMSTGMRQRLALAAALIGEPRYLVLDEPFSGLDPDAVAWLQRILRRLAVRGVGVLAASHQWTELAPATKRLMLIAQGRMRGIVSAEEASRAESLEQLVCSRLTANSMGWSPQR